MATGFFAVFDDIAALLDDAAMMSKIATKKTAGLLGDDLAVGAEQASGFSAKRELPILWAITKGSFRNKLIILPIAFLLSAFAPWLIIPILLLGGLYLGFEGAEKIYEYFFPHKHAATIQKSLSEAELLIYEKKKVKSAILTDFILSIEIIVVGLSTVLGQPLALQVMVVSFVALLATIGVYGFVALLVRMDDLGYKLLTLSDNKNRALTWFGQALVSSLPKIIRLLSVVGTIAMLLVSGGIFVHNIEALHHAVAFMPSLLAELLVGIVIGLFVLLCEKLIMKLRGKQH